MPVDWATVGTSLGVSLAGGGLAGVAANLVLGILQHRLKRSVDISRLEMDKWKVIEQSFEKQIEILEKAGQTEQANSVRIEYAEQQAAWRAQQGVTALAPREVRSEGGSSLAVEEVAELRRLLAASAGLNPGALSAQDYFLRGNSYYNTGQYHQALAEYNRALELLPDNRHILYNRGTALARLERYEEALADFNRVLDLHPDDPATLTNRGNALAGLERYLEALADYNRALELRPDHPTNLTNRGNALASLERYLEALTDYNRALELRPDHPATLNNRGVALRRLGRYEEALADYNRALELRPDHPDTLYHMACLFSLTGRYQEALDWLRRTIEGDAKYRSQAVEDPAFAPLRDHPQFGPQFRQLVAGDG